MKPMLAISLLLTMVVWLSCCSKAASTVAADGEKSAAASRAAVPATSPPVRLSLADATSSVRDEVFRSNPNMNPSADFPLKELTTSEVWDRLHVQVFAVTSGVYEDQCFIIRDREVFPLGGSFGGFGVMSMCVADLNSDGQPKLVFSYSWGSGIHRSLVGVWTGGPAWIDAKPVLKDYDLSVEKVDDGHIRVVYGKFSSAGTFKRFGEFGTLQLSVEKAGFELEIILNPQLPVDVSNRVWR